MEGNAAEFALSRKVITVIDATELYNFVPVQMTLTFIQGHSVTRNLEFCTYSVIKWLEVSPNFGLVNCAREMTTENSFKHGYYGLFEHLLFHVTCFKSTTNQ